MQDIKMIAFFVWAFVTGRFVEIRKVSQVVVDHPFNDQWVYFIGDTERKVVKIGISNNVARRLVQVQTGYPYRLVLLCAVPGGEELEQQLHRVFLPLHLNGEWFKLDYRLKSYIALVTTEMIARAKDSEL